MGRISRTRLALAVVLAAASTATEAGAQDDWQSAYQLGDSVELKITDGIWQTCVVSENPPGGMLRVMCEEYVESAPGTYTRAGGTYIVYGRSDLRRAGSAAAAPATRPPAVATRAESKPGKATKPATRPAPATPAPAPARGGLTAGEYACYGNGGQILAGLGFKVVGNGRYTDLEGGNSGSYSVNGDTVTFRGGHLDGHASRPPQVPEAQSADV